MGLGHLVTNRKTGFESLDSLKKLKTKKMIQEKSFNRFGTIK